VTRGGVGTPGIQRADRTVDRRYDGPPSIGPMGPRFRATPDARKEGLLRAGERLEEVIR
jgi:hypothetical protein